MGTVAIVKHAVLVGTFFAVLAADLIFVRLLKPLHRTGLDAAPRSWRAVTVVLLVLLILGSCWVMTLNPLWNGQLPQYRDQYERLADAFLDGHLYIDYGSVDPKLLAMDNPYDTEAREALGVEYHWDHAFYNGHYYMYFGVVPVLLLFLPFKALTGLTLTTFHATQLFVSAFFCGVFLLFRLLARRFFKEISFGAWLMLTLTVSVTSLWNCIACPALYNTAVSSALCMEIWSLYFYIKAVWDTEDADKALRLAFLGGLFGALAAGCRPPIALGNLVAIPLLVRFLKQHRMNGRLWLRLLLVLLPYVAVAAGLMWYNNVRFDSPFEFGQSYQLTVADQSRYGSRSLADVHWVTLVNGLLFNFFRTPELSYEFPFVGSGGVFLVYPVFCYIFLGLCDAGARRRIREQRLTGTVLGLALCPVVITCVDVLWAPFLNESYRQDILWLVGILCFLLAGLRWQAQEDRLNASRWLCRWCLWSLAVGFLLFANQVLITQ